MKLSLRDELALVLKGLGLLSRLCHHRARKPVIAAMIGVLVMLLGGVIAHEKHVVAAWIGLHTVVVDTVGAAVHGIGLIPFVKFAEPLWIVLLGAE